MLINETKIWPSTYIPYKCASLVWCKWNCEIVINAMSFFLLKFKCDFVECGVRFYLFCIRYDETRLNIIIINGCRLWICFVWLFLVWFYKIPISCIFVPSQRASHIFKSVGMQIISFLNIFILVFQYEKPIRVWLFICRAPAAHQWLVCKKFIDIRWPNSLTTSTLD